MITYQVEYRDREGEWCKAGPSLRNYSDALAKLKEENYNDPEYTHRIVQSRTETVVVSVLAGQLDLKEEDE